MCKLYKDIVIEVLERVEVIYIDVILLVYVFVYKFYINGICLYRFESLFYFVVLYIV